MKRLGIIDIGSNSVRLVLVDINAQGHFKIFNEFKETVRLGETDSKGMLTAEKMQTALETLGMFKTICEAVRADEIVTAATAAVRRAPNKNEFLTLVYERLGLRIRVLSGEEEAYYAYCGVINSIDEKSGLIMDLGGGSTELVHFEDGVVKNSISLPFGAIDVTRMFDTSNSVSAATAQALRRFLFDELGKVNWLKDLKKNIPLIGVGGTIRNIGKIDKKSKDYPLDMAHYYIMDPSSVCSVYEQTKDRTLEQRIKIKGLSKDRADIFFGACAVVWHILEYCRIDRLVVSGSGLREGLVYDYIGSSYSPVGNMLDFSLNNIISQFNINRVHAYQVYKLASSMYVQLEELFGSSRECEKILKTAALLHDSGISINFYSHDSHAFYMILNSGINGLTHREILMSAYAASLHRNTKLKLKWKQYSQILSEDDIRTIMKISILLRLSESLDTCMDNFVEDIKCRVDGESVEMNPIAKKKPNVEISRAINTRHDFEQVFGKKLLIQ
ncbi:guanosine-5'-triphosphate,3'-diphosphate pyrophosphatase GppA [Peptoclostridium acidaminophilum DSM 3953]|uniref:Guanosine-5'-triphosphate,3'-diphosphate pyrophosphatase GppA n=1 Tax=Peptoclostridium acidaminophilum DSM 3953 TaxID=1286171 RepID=W8T4N6_PEPAC|nr:Ppx/GppA phosphatase family protein [Peptoclostridium acidaminophilum]AHM56714.1 guanosine-5'-triphosphate,3'-diphosphate pyrophosphatase GppA [Peptoclostridium acidaminophilum DSM 3953]